MLTKRFFELKYNDVFTYMGKKRIVTRVENGFIYFGISYNGMVKKVEAVSWHSKEKVEYHFNKDKK